MEDGSNDLPAAGWIGTAVAVTLEHDSGPVVGLDHGSQIWAERPLESSPEWIVRAAEASIDATLAVPIRDIQMLLPTALEIDRPTLRVGKANSVQMLESHGHLPGTAR
jgi:hypothetical protein